MQAGDPIRRLLSTDMGRFTQGIDVGSLWRWVKLSVGVGLVTGLLASLVFYVLEWSEAMLLTRVTSDGEIAATFFSFAQQRLWWLIVALPTAGGLATGLLLYRFDRGENQRQGADAMIHGYHQDRGRVSARRSTIRVAAAALTMGTGGSAGREGIMAYAGAGFGSIFANRFKLSAHDRRMLVLAGAAGGISALFRTPLGAALFALEIIYKEDFESEGMFPVIVSSVTAYSVFTSIFGQGSLFHVPDAGYGFHPAQLPFYGLMALAVAPLAVLWCKAQTSVGPAAFAKLDVPKWLKPAVGGFLLGSLALALPWVLGAGHGWIQQALLPTDDPGRLLPVGYQGFGLLLGIAIAKMLATTLTLSSGGSGGVFAPTLFIGGFLGGACGLLFHEIAPSVVSQPGAFVLVGMGAFYAGAAKAPLSTIIMISELFGSYDLLVPLMLAIMISLLLLRHVSLFPSQVGTAVDSPAHAGRFTVDVLESLKVEDHYAKGLAKETVPSNMPLGDFLEHVSATAESFFVVRSPSGKIAGTVSLDHVRSVVSEHEVLDFLLVGDAMTPFYSIPPSATLDEALKAIIESGHECVPVQPKDSDEILGILSQTQIVAEYNAEILRRRLGPKDPDET